MSITSDIIQTHNGYGWTSTIPNQTTLEYLKFVSSLNHERTVSVDVGAGLGVGTLPALEAGTNVIALDLDSGHLRVIEEAAKSRKLIQLLTTVEGAIPGGPQFYKLDAIHCSNVLHFLRGEEIMQCAEEMYGWLKEGGKIFIQVGTIYAGHIKRLMPMFVERRRRKVLWAGEVEDAKAYIVPELRELTPNFMNYLDGPPLVEAFTRVGFKIEKAWYYTRTGLPQCCVNDGREHFGLIATKLPLTPLPPSTTLNL